MLILSIPSKGHQPWKYNWISIVFSNRTLLLRELLILLVLDLLARATSAAPVCTKYNIIFLGRDTLDLCMVTVLHDPVVGRLQCVDCTLWVSEWVLGPQQTNLCQPHHQLPPFSVVPDCWVSVLSVGDTQPSAKLFSFLLKHCCGFVACVFLPTYTCSYSTCTCS